MDTVWIELGLIVVAIVANGFFAGAEIAVVSARVSRLTGLRDAGRAGAATALRLKESPEAFLATIQIAITSVGTLASAVGGAAAVELITPALAAVPVPLVARWAGPLALALVVVAITYGSLVIGELVPKALALQNPERAACLAAPPVERLSRLSGWLVTVLTASTNAVLRLLGQRTTSAATTVSEEDVRFLVREGAAHGVFEKEEAALVHRVFEFTDTTVKEIMVPRPAVRGLDVATPPAEVLAAAVAQGKSRLPVFRDSIEHIVGVVTLKDLARRVAAGEPLDLARVAQPALFVPETVLVSGLLREFRQSHQEFAVVVDEYGSVVGVATLEDVVAEIVGGLPGETAAQDIDVTRLPDGSLVLGGALPAEVARERLGLPLPDSDDYQSVAGYIIHRLNAIPTPGMSVQAGDWRLTVVDMEGPRIARVKAQRGRP